MPLLPRHASRISRFLRRSAAAPSCGRAHRWPRRPRSSGRRADIRPKTLRGRRLTDDVAASVAVAQSGDLQLDVVLIRPEPGHRIVGGRLAQDRCRRRPWPDRSRSARFRAAGGADSAGSATARSRRWRRRRAPSARVNSSTKMPSSQARPAVRASSSLARAPVASSTTSAAAPRRPRARRPWRGSHRRSPPAGRRAGCRRRARGAACRKIRTPPAR